MTGLDVVRGYRVAALERGFHSMQIKLGGGAHIGIYTDYRVEGAPDADALVGRTLTGMDYAEGQAVRFEFEDGAVLIVNLADEALHGTECLTLHVPGKRTLVWL